MAAKAESALKKRDCRAATRAIRAQASSGAGHLPRRPTIAVLGAGFGGLEAAKAMASLAADIIVIDQHNHHCFQPLLYQVATAALSPADVAWPIRHILKGQTNATVLLAEVTGIDADSKLVHTSEFSIAYDYLVVATGALHSYFGHEEWAGAAPGLKRIEDATRIRGKLLLAFEKAELTVDPAEGERLLTFVVVGGGPTGVEMAGAIAEVAYATLPPEFRRIDPRHARIVLVEAGPRLLSALPERLSAYAHRALVELGVEILTNARVTDCTATGVRTDNGWIPAGTIVWAAGVKASPAAKWLKAEHDRAGRVLVKPDLSLPGRPEVFVIGDTASVRLPSGQNVPGLAPAAKQMGRHAGLMIAGHLRGSSEGQAFRYRHQGDLATIGRRRAIASLKRLQLTGFIGWIVWALAHIYFLIGLRNRLAVAFTWLWQYFTFERGARLITDVDLLSVGSEEMQQGQFHWEHKSGDLRPAAKE